MVSAPWWNLFGIFSAYSCNSTGAYNLCTGKEIITLWLKHRIDLKEQYPRDITPLIQRAISEHKNLCMSFSNTRSPVQYMSRIIPLFWHLWLCGRASYFISDHLLLKNLLRTLLVTIENQRDPLKKTANKVLTFLCKVGSIDTVAGAFFH